MAIPDSPAPTMNTGMYVWASFPYALRLWILCDEGMLFNVNSVCDNKSIFCIQIGSYILLQAELATTAYARCTEVNPSYRLASSQVCVIDLLDSLIY